MKIDTRNYNNCYLATDFHWHHDKEFIWKRRSFQSIYQHDLALKIELQKLTPDDLLFFHGDLCLNCTQEECEDLLMDIPCKVHFILGNHDKRVWRFIQSQDVTLGMFWVDFENYRFYNGIVDATWVRKDGTKLQCTHSHFPMMEWNYMNHGAWHLSGHSHGNGGSHFKIGGNSQKCLDLAKEVVGRFIIPFNDVDSIMSHKSIDARHHNTQ